MKQIRRLYKFQFVGEARNRIGWEKLDYSPNEEIVLRYLDTFENLINRMNVDDIREDSLSDWLSKSEADDPVYCDFPRCENMPCILSRMLTALHC